MARRALKEYAGYFVTRNTFHVNGDIRRSGASAWTLRTVTLESGFAFAGALLEMLLQSWGGTIRVFPAVPQDWQDISFSDLRAEGAFLVSAERRMGRVTAVEISSTKGMPCKVANPFPGREVVLEDLSRGDRKRVHGGVLSFSTSPNGKYRLSCGGAEPGRPAQALRASSRK